MHIGREIPTDGPPRRLCHGQLLPCGNIKPDTYDDEGLYMSCCKIEAPWWWLQLICVQHRIGILMCGRFRARENLGVNAAKRAYTMLEEE